MIHDEKKAKTWGGRRKGPPCRVCRTPLDRGHRYYENNGSVVHYCCASKESKEKAA